MSTSSDNKLGSSVSAALNAAGMSQYRVARSSGTSVSYLNEVIHGRKLPSPQWLDIIATATGLTPEQRVELHRCAAKSHGFKIDLT